MTRLLDFMIPRGVARAIGYGRLPVPDRFVVILPGWSDVVTLSSDLACLGREVSPLLPPVPLGVKEGVQAHLLHRGRVLEDWIRLGGGLITSAAGAVLPALSPSGHFQLRKGDRCRSSLIHWISSQGYERVPVVWAPGQWALRGALVDLFPPGDRAIRVAFDDDLVEEIRVFSPETQRAVASLDSWEMGGLKGGGALSLLDVPVPFGLVVFEPGQVETQCESAVWLWEQMREEVHSLPAAADWSSLASRVQGVIRVSSSQGDPSAMLGRVPSFAGRLKEAEGFVLDMRSKGFRTLFLGSTRGYVEWAAGCGMEVIRGSASEGALDLSERVLYLSEVDVAGVRPPSSPAGKPPADVLDSLISGDLMVHEDYGVCRFLGIEMIEQGGVQQDYIALEFAQGKRLLIPTYRIARLHRYAGDPAEAELDSLKRGRWSRSYQEAKRKAREAAERLLSAQARRHSARGIAFDPLEREMEELRSTFPYRETVDQVRCWEEIRADMERPVPMDRLLVGDVGFGKTELALRAAFKAAMSGYQVVVVTPTTLLASQHLSTFASRLSPFPLRVEALYRFVPRSRQDEILNDFAEGRVDILIGTHRILGDDVRARNLGLIVLDEEHRFGVMQKERWRERFPGADVLMLSATPIPRTLQLALGGYKDISVMTTPPVDRRPVVTVVSPWQDELVKGAVLRELGRGGQVFWVHNRIQSMHRAFLRAKALLPGVRVEMAHGRMRDSELESLMARFVEGRLDVLLCTTIIESGLDLPRVNTIIVEDAHRMGLAQLYQLRGRVGRRSDQAFALFLYPRGAEAGRALERLEAIGSLEELGSGFHLAMMDLSIRGGGELLGTAQHGHVSSLSPELYFQMLEREVTRLKGGAELPPVEWGYSPSIPEWYVEDQPLRVRLYRRLFLPMDASELDQLRDEMVDRFGPVPHQVEELILAARLRVLLAGLASEITIGRDQVQVRFRDSAAVPKGLPPMWRVKGVVTVGPAGVRGLSELIEALSRWVTV
ncbi:DEAD/DEAH box helicase [Thermanaerovibrio acidaminovorans]|uniref:DEAD/DEAH box helicase n=1 Tax=Thermanaerovibrio acidaminovorans TaxID=81462 RepID=UPI0024930654|nr:DEAD/DEAH box helicase [Thermanaerovibrio acidaminovorans]